ncbi:MAG TPA: LLM class flavin-dependent oxidoreductase [Thermomicrobiales bacterium]|nr:LLM class flavin-dependent oxidoreductase [Thermomicrobiales bacterium]
MSAGTAPWLKIGLYVPFSERQMAGQTPRWADILAFARRAEAVGFDSLWVPDHLIQYYEGVAPRGGWECWTLVTALATVTTRVELGTIVAATSFRNPAVTAKIVDTLEEISGGRVIVGLGAGYHEPEYRAFGLPYDHLYSRFAEALTIIHGLLRHGHIDFAGRFYQARDCELRPRGGPRPAGPPIMIGSSSPKMLGLLARYADLWNTWLVHGDSHPAAIPPLRERVDAACREAGRDPATVGRTATVLVDYVRTDDVAMRLMRPASTPRPIVGDTDEIAATLRGFAAEGIGHLQVFLQPNSLAGIERFAPVLEAVRRQGDR